MARESEKIPGALWNFSQPIADNMEEAVSGVKGELAIKIFGTDLKQLEAKGDEIIRLMGTIQGVQDLGLFRVNRTAESQHQCRPNKGLTIRT